MGPYSVQSLSLPIQVSAWWRTQSQSNQCPPLNSLLTGKRTGYLLELHYLKKFLALIWEQTERFIAEFPTLQNWELFRKNREFWCSNRESNPANSTFAPIRGFPYMPFMSAYTMFAPISAEHFRS